MHRTRKLSLWLLLAIAVIFSGYLLFSPDRPTGPGYTFVSLQRGDLLSTVSATGTLNPVITVQVGSQVSGIIEHMYVDFNDQVDKDQLIARIEPSLFKTQVAQAQANLQSAIATQEKAVVAVKEAHRQLLRVTNLYEKNMVSESDLDAARFAHEAAQVEQRVKEAAIAQARASLAQTEVNLQHTNIHAPIKGVVVSRDVDVGQTVAASLQAPTLFTIAQDLTRMQIETEVDEAYIGQIREGQVVRFRVFAYAERVFDGRVVQVRLQPKVESGVVKYNCVIHVDNPDLALKPGMTATVEIEVSRREGVLKVPNTALRFVPEIPAAELKQLRNTLQRGESILWAQDTEGLQPVKVTTGVSGEEETEVISTQLQEGMKIALPGDKANGTGTQRRGLHLF